MYSNNIAALQNDIIWKVHYNLQESDWYTWPTVQSGHIGFADNTVEVAIRVKMLEAHHSIIMDQLVHAEAAKGVGISTDKVQEAAAR